jgi:hypothetical protein
MPDAPKNYITPTGIAAMRGFGRTELTFPP